MHSVGLRDNMTVNVEEGDAAKRLKASSIPHDAARPLATLCPPAAAVDPDPRGLHRSAVTHFIVSRRCPRPRSRPSRTRVSRSSPRTFPTEVNTRHNICSLLTSTVFAHILFAACPRTHARAHTPRAATTPFPRPSPRRERSPCLCERSWGLVLCWYQQWVVMLAPA